MHTFLNTMCFLVITELTNPSRRVLHLAHATIPRQQGSRSTQRPRLRRLHRQDVPELALSHMHGSTTAIIYIFIQSQC